MKCPHCNTSFHNDFRVVEVINPTFFMIEEGGASSDPQISWTLLHQLCPECHESIFFLKRRTVQDRVISDQSFMVYPRSSTRPIAPEVPDPYRQDFLEACAVLADSAKASAALSRRCLQAILKDKLGAKKKDLNDQIDEVIALGSVPHIAEDLHAVRNIGNFAAHPMKSTSTGTIVDVEPGEAEWNLEVVEQLFDFCFVQPAIRAKRKAMLNEKLKDIGKPTI
jgi:Domain of unknown function (DUF4145)